jgi:glucose/arabinose dehydrogenase
VKRLLPIVLLAVVAFPKPCAGEPQTWSLDPIVEGLQQPTSVAWAPDGRLFVAEREGQVRVVSADRRVTGLFLDLRPDVAAGGERGLLSIALDPAFARNGRIFLLLTRQRDGQPPDEGPATGQVISIAARPDEPDVADRATLRVVLSGFGALSQVHAGGDLAFDRRGRLLASFGDGSSDQRVDARALRSQDLDDLAGKLVRVDPSSGAGVPENPWFDERRPAAVRSKVLAYGLRNPWRIAVDPLDGAVWVGDVGWTSWEEVDRVPPQWTDAERQLDFGWPCREGPRLEASYARNPDTRTACAPFRTPDRSAGPRHAYAHRGRGASVTLGPVLAAPLAPAFPGPVVVADFVRQSIGTLDRGGSFRSLDRVRSETSGSSVGWGSIVDVTVGPDGRLALVDIGAGAVATLRPGTARRDDGVIGPLGGWAVLLVVAGAGALVVGTAIVLRRRRDGAG